MAWICEPSEAQMGKLKTFFLMQKYVLTTFWNGVKLDNLFLFYQSLAQHILQAQRLKDLVNPYYIRVISKQISVLGTNISFWLFWTENHGHHFMLFSSRKKLIILKSHCYPQNSCCDLGSAELLEFSVHIHGLIFTPHSHITSHGLGTFE